MFSGFAPQLSLVGILIIASSAASLASPFLLRHLLDVAFPNRNLGLAAAMVSGMIAVSVGTTIFDVLQSKLSTDVGQGVMHRLRTGVYAHLQRLDLAFFTRTRTGEVQSRIAGDIGSMQSVVTSTGTTIVSSATTVIGALIAMIALDWRLTIVSVILMPAFIAISRQVGRQRRAITHRRQSTMADMSASVAETLSVSGILLGKTMGATPLLTEKFDRQSRDLADLEIDSAMAGRWRQSIIGIVLSAMPAAVYLVAAIALSGGADITVGTVVAFTSLQSALFRPLMSLLRTGVEVSSSLAMFGRVFEYLDLPVGIADSEQPTPLNDVRGEVRVTNMNFRYPGADRPALDGISLTVPAGTRLAVVGATGSGKTTLGYLLARLYDADSGTIQIDGVDIAELDARTRTSAVGIVSQETFLQHATIADNLRFAKPDATPAELVNAARAAQIHELIDSLPDGYDTMVGERGYRFSGGEKQRLAIARMVLRNPPILILDEATSALDNRTEAAVVAALDALAEGRTVIAIAHRLSTVANADQIVVMDRGRIVERGTWSELVDSDGAFASLARRDGLLAV